MKTQKILLYLAVAFAAFYLFSRPAEAASAVRGMMDGISTGAGRLAQFFSHLFA
ncbi:hypothetical protein Sru01_18760 [Sphaerisporangium rufum]|uniref:Uncharacterized protein n=1 Tax=Sphaerisporangium rufum TaxID=1381558 RepID=A0A919QZH9_9ACTN|nr:hypothetical protein [Sphaerisporangium rufum]GII76894.1 hypothetical protein Sru01_18760 [Sphaerisporangium rufum]